MPDTIQEPINVVNPELTQPDQMEANIEADDHPLDLSIRNNPGAMDLTFGALDLSKNSN